MQLLTPVRQRADRGGQASAAPVSGSIQKSCSLPQIQTNRSLSSLPAIPEVNRPFALNRQYDSEDNYRRDLLVFSAYNAAGLLKSRSVAQLESPEKRVKRALEEVKLTEEKIHSRVLYLQNQERKVFHRINQARQVVVKMLSAKRQKELEAQRFQKQWEEQCRRERELIEESKKIRQ